MSTFPVRGIGSSGIVTDLNPYNLEDASTLSEGVNVRFKDGKVSRGPVARTVHDLVDLEPGHSFTIPVAANGVDEIIVAEHDFGRVVRINGQSVEDLTPADWSPVDGTDVFSSTFLGGVAYLNRFTHEPIYKAPGDERFQKLPGWDPDWRCSRLIAYRDTLVAIGVQKGGQVFPTMVKWSDFANAGFGAPPQSWDVGDTEKSAGENIVSEMQHAIVDAFPLRSSLLLYCTNSVWTMNYVGGNFVFQFDKLFDARGVINANSVVQVEGQHYVFDRNDIYTTDGASLKSICDGRVRRHIFQSIDYSLVHLCFVSHDPRLSEVRFHYPSSDRLVGFRRPQTGCNRCAVFNYSDGSWTFYDTPNVTSSTTAAVVSGLTWEEADVSWDDIGGLWLSSNGDEDKHVLYVGRSDLDQGLTKPRIYGFDLMTGGRLALPPELEALRPAFIERVGIDLDVTGKNLRQYVRLLDVWPQMSVQVPGDAWFQFGANDLVGREPEWTERIVHDPDESDFIDLNEAGKYLAYRFSCGGVGDFELSGFDATLEPGGRR